MNVGDIHWVALPASGGHAQAGRRPAIVVQDASASEHLPTIFMVPLITQLESMWDALDRLTGRVGD